MKEKLCQSSSQTFGYENQEYPIRTLKASEIKDCDAFGDIPSDVEITC